MKGQDDSENAFSYLCLAQNALGYHGDRSLLSSLVGWIAGNATPSFIEGQSLSVEVMILGLCSPSAQRSEFPLLTLVPRRVLFTQVWFAWLVLNMEGLFEEESQLRRCIENELLAEPSISPDQALKVH